MTPKGELWVQGRLPLHLRLSLIVMLRAGASFAAGAGLSLAAVHFWRASTLRPSSPPSSSSAACADVQGECENARASTRPDGGSDWGSPVLPLPQASDGNNKTMSPSKLPRPRKLFSDREGQGTEVGGCP